jgi:hypothetical protein
LSSDPVDHQHRKPDIAEAAAHQRLEVLGGAGDELAPDRRLRGRALRGPDVFADRLLGAAEATRRDAGQHALEHRIRERVAVCEVREGLERDLLGVVGPSLRAGG